jgi:hypothetical protein
VRRLTPPGLDQLRAARALQVLGHALGGVLVVANYNVDVIGHHRAGIARIPLALDHLTERLGDDRPLRVVEGQQWVFQHRGGTLVEVADDPAGGLDRLAAVMKFAEFAEYVGRNGV